MYESLADDISVVVVFEIVPDSSDLSMSCNSLRSRESVLPINVVVIGYEPIRPGVRVLKGINRFK